MSRPTFFYSFPNFLVGVLAVSLWSFYGDCCLVSLILMYVSCFASLIRLFASPFPTILPAISLLINVVIVLLCSVALGCCRLFGDCCFSLLVLGLSCLHL